MSFVLLIFAVFTGFEVVLCRKFICFCCLERFHLRHHSSKSLRFLIDCLLNPIYALELGKNDIRFRVILFVPILCKSDQELQILVLV